MNLRVGFLLAALVLTGCGERTPPPLPPPVEPLPAPAPVASKPAENVPVSSVKPAKTELCPPEMALVAGKFCIDRWEAHTVSLEGTAHSPYHSVMHEKVRAESRPGVVPQAYISMQEADGACTRAGKRLCTTQQWVDACMGTDERKSASNARAKSEAMKRGSLSEAQAKSEAMKRESLSEAQAKSEAMKRESLSEAQAKSEAMKRGGGTEPRSRSGTEPRSRRMYPYGNVRKPEACNVRSDRGHPLMALHEGRRPTDSVNMNDPSINQVSSTVAPAGAFEECTTPDGVADLVGNLLEWTRGSRPLLMGGYYLDATENGHGCTYVTMRHGEDYHDFSTGFRCCLEPEPAALKAHAETKEAAVEKPLPSATSANEPRDPPGFRSFMDPGAKLPPKPEKPAYDPPDAACPVDMALVEGRRCNSPEQTCRRWLEVPGQEPERSCAEFAPSVCKGGTRAMRYCIDRYEYTPEGWSLPLVNVSWGEAQNICNAMDKRICVEDEWEFACEGPDALPYPYGTVRDGAACNHDLPDLFDPRQKLYDRRVPTDSLPRCKSPFGVFNLVGNVDEWTTRVGKQPPWRSILRGGWWLTGRNRCRAATESHSELYAGSQTSFRCCKAARAGAI